MLVSNNWTDYELLDASRGERLERWGEHILIRPDPQVIWDTAQALPAWKNPSARYLRDSGGGRWEKNSLPELWSMSYRALKFRVRPTNFKHMGLFPEQAVNWDYIAKKITASGRQLRVLNLFAYTGGATLAAAAAGASVCHVDAARGMVQWARENAAHAGLEDRPVRWLVDDCVKFLERELRRGSVYDAVIMDPPSYGRGPSGETWKLEDDIFRLVQTTARVLSETPEFVIINSYTAGLSPGTLNYIVDAIITKRFGGRSQSDELGLPVTASGLILPCGATTRWERHGNT